jgi:hypothetical protein
MRRIPDPLQTLRQRNPVGLAIAFVAAVAWSVAAIVLVWRSPIRQTPTWMEVTLVSIAVGVAATAAWAFRARRVANGAPPRPFWWMWLSAIGWFVAVISAPAAGFGLQPPSDAYTIAALWYQVTGFLGTGFVTVWLHRTEVRDRARQSRRRWRRVTVTRTRPPTP